MTIATLAAGANGTEPSSAKFFAMLLAIGGFLLAAKVYDRIKRAKNGEQVDPFSREADFGTLDEKPQASAPIDTPEEAPQEGVEKGSRWTWRRQK